VKWLKKNKFHFLDIFELDEIIHGKRPFPTGGVFLTADDGWQSNKDNIAPIVNEHNIPITIFISTKPVEKGIFWWSYWLKSNTNAEKSKIEEVKSLSNRDRRKQVFSKRTRNILSREALTPDEVIQLSRSQYISIGSHTHNHPILPKCNDNEAQFEIQTSKEKLKSWIQKEINYFSYPNGDFGVREINILKTLNFRLAFGTDPKYLTPESLKEKYNIPRFCFVEGASFAENICRMVGIWKFSKNNHNHK
jgi:peptidoglycan/xylan/chitin deacetylase (PgdA/CDA1 family)